MQNITAFKVLQLLAESIRQEIIKVLTVLEDAKNMIKQIILAAFQSGILTDAIVRATKTQADIEKMWEGSSADESIPLVQKRVKLFASQPDIIILCDETLTELRS